MKIYFYLITGIIFIISKSFAAPSVLDDVSKNKSGYNKASEQLLINYDLSNLDEVAGSEYKKTILSILSFIEDRNLIFKNTNFNVNEFEKKISGLNIYLNTGGKKIVGSGSRGGGVNFPEQSTIILNGKVISEIVSSLNSESVMYLGYQIFLLHEALWALGYLDKNYEISTYLIMNTYRDDYRFVLKPYEEALRQHLRQSSGQPLKNELFKLSSGGSTGVGGGGDPASALLKIMSLLNFSKYIENQPNFLKKYFNINQSDFGIIPEMIMNVRVEPILEDNGYNADTKVKQEIILSIVKGTNENYIAISSNDIFHLKEDFQIGPVSFEFIKLILKIKTLEIKK